MGEHGKDDLLIKGSGWGEDEVLQESVTKKQERTQFKTVMVYRLDKNSMQKEPIGILTERRKLERDNNNAIGMLRWARKEYAKTEEESQGILIGEYV